MQDSESKKFTFHILEENDIEDCSDLISNVYVIFSAMSNYLKYDPSDLKVGAKNLLWKILEDKTTMVAKDPEGKIIGCWVGVKLNKLAGFNSNKFKFRKDISFDLDVEKMNYNEKASILAEVEYIMLKEHYDNLVDKKESDLAVLGKFLCINPDYFGTSLSKYLVFYFGRNLIQKGLKHCYGVIYNKKAANIFTKHFPIKILNECKVTLTQASKSLVLDTFLFYTDVELGKSVLSKF